MEVIKYVGLLKCESLNEVGLAFVVKSVNTIMTCFMAGCYKDF